MRAELLFLHRYEQMALLVEAHGELDLLDLAARLYQMIGDKHPLMDSANVRRLPLRFRATDHPPPDSWLLEFAAIYSFEDSIDPEVVKDDPDNQFVRDLTKEEFLALKVMWLEGKPLTIKHIVGYARNVAGGGHHDPTPQYGEYAALGEARECVEVGGSPLGLRQLRAIGRVVVRALRPLHDDIISHEAAPRP